MRLVKETMPQYKELLGTDIGHGMGLVLNEICAAPTIEAEPKWIPVTERLPEIEGRYLCVRRIGKSGMVYVQLMNGDSYGFSMEHIYTDDVTHWMPLPNPPKMDGGAE